MSYFSQYMMTILFDISPFSHMHCIVGYNMSWIQFGTFRGPVANSIFQSSGLGACDISSSSMPEHYI